jgi:hypothetical protein
MESEPGFAVTLSSDAATTGTAWLYAAGDGQAALESDEIGGAIFTHFWLAGLRGAADANGDGRVTLDESFTYAYGETLLRSTRSGGVLQRPEEKLELTEESPVVLTQLSPLQARLALPRGGDALYLVYAIRSQTVVAEVYGVPDRPVRLSLSPGRYIVQRRAGARGGAAEVSVDAQSERSLQETDFRAFSDDALALKGTLVVHPWSLSLADTAFGGLGVDVGDELSLQIGLRDAPGAWGIALGPVGGLEHRGTAYNQVSESFLGAEVSVDRFVRPSPSVTLRLGLDVRGEWIWQRVTRNDADRLASAGLAASASYAGAAWGGGPHVGARFWLTPRLFLDAGARMLALGAKTDSGAEGRLLGGGSLGMGVPW